MLPDLLIERVAPRAFKAACDSRPRERWPPLPGTIWFLAPGTFVVPSAVATLSPTAALLRPLKKLDPAKGAAPESMELSMADWPPAPKPASWNAWPWPWPFRSSAESCTP